MKTGKERDLEVIQLIKRQLTGFSENLTGFQVILFGSRASGKNREKSDFDIGIMGIKQFPRKLFYELEDRLERIDTLYKIDLVDLNSVSARFRNEALSNYKILYE